MFSVTSPKFALTGVWDCVSGVDAAVPVVLCGCGVVAGASLEFPFEPPLSVMWLTLAELIPIWTFAIAVSSRVRS